MLSLEDKFAIHQLINEYGHIIDKGEYSLLRQVFTSQAVFDLSSFQAGKAHKGIDQIIALMEQSTTHPVAHHATNIVVKSSNTAEVAIVESKGLGVGLKGRVGSVVYKDRLSKREGSWKIERREVQLLSEPASQLVD